MPITVVCPGCHKRFKVSDEHAGKKGPCPKCKTQIKVPDKSDEVVLHEPENFGPKDTSGRATLKPIERTETKVSLLLTVIIIVTILLTLGVAWMFRPQEGEEVAVPLLAFGAIILAPGLAWAGYTFLRDDELEPHRGSALWIRIGACALVYAILWGLLAFVKSYFEIEIVRFDDYTWAIILPIMVAIGSFAAYASLDLEFGTAAIHYGMYLGVTVVLRLIMGLPAI